MTAKKTPLRKNPLDPDRPPVIAPPEGPSGEDDGGGDFLVVALGSSAGGLEAVTQFFQAMPSDRGMAFVLVSHLDPGHKSALVEILSKVTSMAVVEVQEGMSVEPDHVYAIPPNSELTIARGVLHLVPRPDAHTPPMPIDVFLRSLAEDRKSQSVGVILSGTGSDGTRGMKAIKEAGGITFAQDDSAQHSGMPQSAVLAGAVDFILSPSNIAAELARLTPRAFRNPDGPGAGDPAQPDKEDAFHAIIHLLSQSSGVDFNHYKYPTLRRRIERRLIIRKLKTPEEYLDCLDKEPEELQDLFQEVLIPVTGFFRDPGVFEALKSTVFPRLMKDRPLHTPIRLWVAGCSTGEEVYSLAICLLEFLGDRISNTPIKLFGTDISDRSLAVARAGSYQDSSMSEVSPERQRRFFHRTDGRYQINKAVRDVCVFARHDVTRAPPFPHMDLVSCRNLLIYLGPVLQSRVFQNFHYSLRPEGVLVLGASETVGVASELFEPLDKQQKFFKRTAKIGHLQYELPSASPDRLGGRGPGEGPRNPSRNQDVQRELDRLILERYTPAGVVVDEQFQVIQFRGRTGSYLEAPSGVPTADVLQMAREGLLPALRDALQRARQDGVSIRNEGVHVKSNGHWIEFSLVVVPITPPSSGRRHFAVLFEQTPAASGTPPVPRPVDVTGQRSPETDREIAHLKQELETMQGHLRSVIEGQEAANEELKAANEEIISSNEELQSTNEELETSKEELEATNEELTSVNDELQSRIRTVSQLTDDLGNLIDSVNIPTLVVRHDMRLGRFSPSAQQMLNLLPADVGRPIGDFKLKINVPDLEPMIREVLDSLSIKLMEVKDMNGRWFRMCVRPYKTTDNRIDGAVITLVDIDALKQQAQQIEEARDYSVSILETMRQPLVVLRGDLRVQSANRAFYESFRTTPAETENLLFFSLENGRWNIPRLRTLLDKVLSENSRFDDFEVEHDFPEVGHRVMILNALRIQPHQGVNIPLILLAMEDITERRKAEKALREGEERFRLNELEKEVLEVSVREQRRIGQELHDGVGQELTGLSLLASALVHRAETKATGPGDLPSKIRDGLIRVQEQVRSLSRGLIPVEFDTEGLRIALIELTSRISEQSGIKCVLNFDDAVTFTDTGVATHVYRITQEAVNNALRHGQPRGITIALRREGDAAILTIQDDGVGLSPNAQEGRGMGLRIMQYRAGLIGAELVIGPATGGGTLVTCRIRKGPHLSGS